MGVSFLRQAVPERALARIGTTIQEKYRIDRLIGVGATAAVFSATHRNGHRVAIKLLLDIFLDDAEAIRRFRREAYVANQVGHPGAVPVLDDDLDESGNAFLIMPLLEGETLRARWERKGKRLPLAETGVLMSDVLEVLESAHANGIIHRDIKPDNLFVASTGHARVLDFGIARRNEIDGSATLTGHMVGTPAFMPPEQAMGERRSIAAHSDGWAVSATIFTLLTGEFVHHADSGLAQLAAAATRHARSLAEVDGGLPAEIVRFVDKGLAYETANRWPSAREMRDALWDAWSSALGEPMAAIEKRVREEIAAELVAGTGDPAEATTAAMMRVQAAGAGHDESGAPRDPTMTATAAPVRVGPVREASAVRQAAAVGEATQVSPESHLELPAAAAGGRARKWWWFAMGTALLATAAALPLGLRRRAIPPPVSPLAAPSSVLACPILEASGVPEPSGWLGAAAAATVCERAAVILGGQAARTLVPAELLSLPVQPVDHFPEDPYDTAAAREQSRSAARQRASAYVDGRVTKEDAGFRVALALYRADGSEIAHAEGQGRALYEAIRSAMAPLFSAERLGGTRALDPTYAEWSRAKDVDSALALLDLHLALNHNSGSLADECARFRPSIPGVSEMAIMIEWLCAYTVGLVVPTVTLPPLDVSASPGALAARARLQSIALNVEDPQLIATLREHLTQQRTAIGRSVLATSISCSIQGSDAKQAADLARLAVQADPRNQLGEFCAPWGQLLSVTKDSASVRNVSNAWQAWGPWRASAWLETPIARNDATKAVVHARRAYLLAPYNALAANALADNLLALGQVEEIRNMSTAMAAVDYPVQKLESDLLLIRLDASQARFGAALARARQGMTPDRHNSSWAQEQRLDMAWRALEIGSVLGRSADVADGIVEQFLDPEPPPLDGNYFMTGVRIPVLCMRASEQVSKRCFSRFRDLRGYLGGGILAENDAFTAGAERYARGDIRGAAKAWRPLAREPGLFTQVLSDAMEDAFERSGDHELVTRLEAIALTSGAGEYNGAAPADVRAARRAAKGGDTERARQLARKVIEAWSVADEPVPAVAEMRKLIAHLPPAR